SFQAEALREGEAKRQRRISAFCWKDAATRLLRRCAPRNDNVAESCLHLSFQAEALSGGEAKRQRRIPAFCWKDAATRLLRRCAPRNDNVA
ncbi:MAG TPA: hypothetical protein VMW13_10455, partial [Dehalococcoidales bacterium]|nr:hypothetical protein [Dehalococcoidales bacterium]